MTTSINDSHPTRSHREYARAPQRAMPYLAEAVPVGLIGASTVALFLLALDTLAGHPLGTPNALGAALFRGEAFSIDAVIRPGLVFGYTLLHIVTFIAVAAAAVSAEYTLSTRGVSAPVQLTAGIAGLFVALQCIFMALTLLLGVAWGSELGFERIVIANGIAALSMAFAVRVRGLGRRVEPALV